MVMNSLEGSLEELMAGLILGEPEARLAPVAGLSVPPFEVGSFMVNPRLGQRFDNRTR